MDDVKQSRVKNLETIIENMYSIINRLELELVSLKQQEQSVEFNVNNNDIDFSNKINEGLSSEQFRLQKLNELKDKNVKLGSRQRIILMKKQNILNKRNIILSKQESKIDDISEKTDDNGNDKVVDRFYDIKGKFYEKQLQHQKEVLSSMKNDNVGFIGANVILIKNTVCNLMRNSIKNISNINDVKQQLNQMIQEGNENIAVNANSMSM